MSSSATPWTVCSLPGSSVHGIFQARILERVAISFWGALPNPGIEPMSSALAGSFFTTESSGKTRITARQSLKPPSTFKCLKLCEGIPSPLQQRAVGAGGQRRSHLQHCSLGSWGQAVSPEADCLYFILVNELNKVPGLETNGTSCCIKVRKSEKSVERPFRLSTPESKYL